MRLGIDSTVWNSIGGMWHHYFCSYLYVISKERKAWGDIDFNNRSTHFDKLWQFVPSAFHTGYRVDTNILKSKWPPHICHKPAISTGYICSFSLSSVCFEISVLWQHGCYWFLLWFLLWSLSYWNAIWNISSLLAIGYSHFRRGWRDTILINIALRQIGISLS
jgi:hypothetical protein